MLPHDELDQLSAYLDGQLDDAARAHIDAHLPSCAECRSMLEGLRATAADLKRLPDEAPTEQDSWALRSAIARARKPVWRWQRFALAAGSAAAALIAIVAVSHQSNTHGTLAENAQANVPVYSVPGNFDKFAAQAHLLDVSGKVPVGVSTPAAAPLQKEARAGAPGGFSQVQRDATQFQALSPGAVPTAELNRCVDTAKQSQQELLDPVRYELATFETTPAFFLFFRTPDRFQLWVMSRDPKHRCDVLFFAQTQ